VRRAAAAAAPAPTARFEAWSVAGTLRRHGVVLPEEPPHHRSAQQREHWAMLRVQVALELLGNPAAAADVPRLVELAGHRARQLLQFPARAKRREQLAEARPRARAGRFLAVSDGDILGALRRRAGEPAGSVRAIAKLLGVGRNRVARLRRSAGR